MANQSAFGSFARKAIVWAIVAIVAIFLFKMVVGIVASFVQLLFGIALLVFVVYAVVWVLRKL